MKKLLKTAAGCVFPLALYYLVSLIMSFVLTSGFVALMMVRDGSFDFERFTQFSQEQTLLLTGLTAAVCIPVFFAMMHADRAAEGNTESRRRPPFAAYLVCVLGAVGACMALNNLISATGMPEADESFQAVSEAIETAPVWAQLLVVVILGPVVEEQIFRGLVYKRIERPYGFLPALILSSLAFGAYHGNLTQLLYAALIGALLAVAYHKTGRFSVCVLMHVAANAMSTVLGRAQDLFLGLNIKYAEILLMVLEIAVGAGLVIIMLAYLKGYEDRHD